MKGKQLLCLSFAVFMLTAFITVQEMKKSEIDGENLDSKSVSVLNMNADMEEGEKIIFNFNEEDLGKLCLSGILLTGNSGGNRDNTDKSSADGGRTNSILAQENKEIKEQGNSQQEVPNTPIDNKDGNRKEGNTNQEEKNSIVDSQRPLVIIYHTHATESYQPASAGNFHILEETSSVREVGTVLTKALEAKGIQVIHDKTIHDNPSYNQSYSRSLKTIEALLNKYPKADMVIDLHRDAAAYTGGAGKTVIVNGETVAKYSLVVGNGNANAITLKAFANEINITAGDLYPGFGGKIIEKAYQFNQYVSDKHILLEIGNNENNIKEAKACAKYFADVIAEVLKTQR